MTNLKTRKTLALSLGGKRADLNPQSTETWRFRTVDAADRFRAVLSEAGLETSDFGPLFILVNPR